MAKRARSVHKANNGKAARVATSRKVELCETKRENSKNDNPIVNRQVTDKPLQYSTLRGKVHSRCTKMPEGKPFQPGQSGNPAGRPRTADLKNAVREFAADVDNRQGKTRLQVWLETMDRMARQGSSKHAELLLAYGWGRPLQQQINLNADVPTGEEADREIQEALAALRGENGGKPTIQ